MGARCRLFCPSSVIQCVNVSEVLTCSALDLAARTLRISGEISGHRRQVRNANLAGLGRSEIDRI